MLERQLDRLLLDIFEKFLPSYYEWKVSCDRPVTWSAGLHALAIALILHALSFSAEAICEMVLKGFVHS